MITVVSHPSGTLENVTSPKDPQSTVADVANQTGLPGCGEAANLPDTWTVRIGEEQITVRLRASDDWRHVTFAANDQDGSAIRAVRTLDGQVWLEQWDPADLDRADRVSTNDERWLPYPLEKPTAHAQAIVEHARQWSDDDIRTFAQILGAKALGHTASVLQRHQSIVDEQQAAVERWERRLRALAIADPDQRETALRIADNWSGAPDHLERISGEITAPAIPGPDALRPSL